MDRFYVWQQQWSIPVFSAVSNEPATTMYPIATVVPQQGTSRMVDIPWQRLAALKHRMVPVIRIPLKAYQRADILEELSRITAQLLESEASCRIDEIQLDLDCPERLLPEYRKLVIQYRSQWPALQLSITALPCHLNNQSFRPLANAVDYYVLQVHGLDVPAHIDDPAALLDPKTAERAIRQAEELGRPYRIALPCYAYELNFDPEKGAFLFLTAEHPTQQQNTLKKRITAKPEDLLKLLQESHALKYSKGIIWFRLPVVGDRLCLPRTSLAKLQEGLIPPDAVECRVVPISNTTIELELFNGSMIRSAAAILTIEWPQSHGTYDLYRQAGKAVTPNILPTELVVPLPPPDQAVRLGWFQTTQTPTIRIEFQ